MAAAKGKNKSSMIALGGIIAALSLALMFATGIIPIATYALPALSGMLLIAIAIEFSTKWAFVVYAAIAILSLIVVPDKEAALLFVFFFGHYPIVKAFLERIKNRYVEWAAKLGVFNLCVLACYGIIFYVFNMQGVIESFGGFGKYGLLVFLGLGNLAFVLYDICLTRLITFYVKYIRVKVLKRI